VSAPETYDEMQTSRIAVLWGMATFSVVATSQLLGGNCCRHFRQSSLLYREVAGPDKTLVPAYQNAQR